MYDLRKASHMIILTFKEKHLRRIMFGHNKNEPWKTSAFNRVDFRGFIAMLTLEAAEDLIAQKGATIDKQDPSQLADSTYMNDIVSVLNQERRYLDGGLQW